MKDTKLEDGWLLRQFEAVKEETKHWPPELLASLGSINNSLCYKPNTNEKKFNDNNNRSNG